MCRLLIKKIMARKEKNIETKKEDVVIENSAINEKDTVIIILLESSKFVKKDTEKKVSGNIANILINKGFAKLK